MHPPEFFFNKIIKSFNIETHPNEDVHIIIVYITGGVENIIILHEQYRLYQSRYDSQHAFLDALCSKHLPRYRQLRNQITEQVRDDQIQAFKLVL